MKILHCNIGALFETSWCAGGRVAGGVLGRQGGGHLVGWEHRLWEEQSLPQEVAATSLVLTHHQNAPYVPPELQEPAPQNQISSM